MPNLCPWCDPSAECAAYHTRNIVLLFDSGRLWHCSDLLPHLIKEHDRRPPNWVEFQEDVLGRKLVVPSELKTVLLVTKEVHLDWEAIHSGLFTSGKMFSQVLPKVTNYLDQASRMWHAATIPKLGDLVAQKY